MTVNSTAHSRDGGVVSSPVSGEKSAADSPLVRAMSFS